MVNWYLWLVKSINPSIIGVLLSERLLKFKKEVFNIAHITLYFFCKHIYIKTKNIMSISIKFPFQETQEGGVFDVNKTTFQATRTNLISLLTTKRRNRVMNNRLYSPLWDYIFEQWDDISSSKLKSELIDKIAEFLPNLNVIDIFFNFDEQTNILDVKVKYEVMDLGGLSDDIEISIPVGTGN